MTLRLRILVVDDEAAQRAILSEILSDEGHEVATAASGHEAMRYLASQPCDLLITDLRMPDGDGLELLREAHRAAPDLEILLMTAYATVATAIEAMKNGAADYLQKPFRKDELVQRVRRLADRTGLVRENRRLRHELGAEAPQLVGESEVMQKLRKHVERLAAVPGDVLVTGESGTGKELVARALHFQGPRAAGPLVAVNCAAIPEGLAESEMLGHEKGAFTHAAAARAGKFEQADGGTLFLDEVSSMPVALQAKLLRVLQERVVERVGSGRPRPVDVRVVAAANRDLQALVEGGTFRQDLYYRLNVHEVHVPPLRERGGDIALLAALFRDRAALRFDVPPPVLGDDLLQFFATYAFPGNVRELEHLIAKMVVLSEGDPLHVVDLPPSVPRAARLAAPSPGGGALLRAAAPPGATAGPDARSPVESLLDSGPIDFYDVETRLLGAALQRTGGNLSEAARLLGISYKTMRYRALKYGLTGDDPGPDRAAD
jgi:two-component system response regulator AtoC